MGPHLFGVKGIRATFLTIYIVEILAKSGRNNNENYIFTFIFNILVVFPNYILYTTISSVDVYI